MASDSTQETGIQRAVMRLAVILVPSFVVLTLSMMFLNLSLPTESYSPFQGSSAMQTIAMAIIGMVSLSTLMLFEGRGKKVDPKSIVFIVAIVILSFLVQYTADPRQLQQYNLATGVFYFLPGSIPIIEAPYFTTIYLLPLFVYGGALGLIVSYLLSDGPKELEKRSNAVLPEFAFRGLLVVFIGPTLLTIPIGFMIVLLQATTLPFFPFYGEGTAGSILVVSVILSMYICARLVSNWDRMNLKSITKTQSSVIASVLVEVIAAYSCTTAAFSLMGGLLTDGTPPALLLPIEYIILTILVTIPMSLLIARERIFPKLVEPQMPNGEKMEPV